MMKVYMDDIIVRSKEKKDQLTHIQKMFGLLRKYNMKLNPKKCTPAVATSEFLGYLVNKRRIKDNTISN